MPVFLLSDNNAFPPPEYAEGDGLLAVGGDLSEERLLLAYSMGIFPWYAEGSPILWWSPNPRLVLIPHELKVSTSLRKITKRGVFKVTMDTAFDEVICRCASIHQKADGGTWITDQMIKAYSHLHNAGYAHSVESWHEGELVGGLYGVALGGAFFGESMFTLKSNASKVAFTQLVYQLLRWDFRVIDCQVTTEHLINFGAKEIPRCDFIAMLKDAFKMQTRRGKWMQSA